MTYPYLKTFCYNTINIQRNNVLKIQLNLTNISASYQVQQKQSFQSLCSATPSRGSESFILKPRPLALKAYIPHRYIWGWLNSVFNRVDESRILDAGPDRACAEWLLRCGAGVKWANTDRWTKDYNSLPSGGARALKIEEVDGTDSAVMHIGFPHFKNCNFIRRVVFHKATYLDDESLEYLPLIKKSLKELQISSCGNISRDGLENIKKLSNLEYLLLYDLPLITDKEEVIRDLTNSLPKCEISFPYAQASERAQEEECT
ncbi:UNVERIFIED_CONTAM: hypothetical protein GTU68_050334 [Idotea baltica]|nr:hypothetical protein [Idotea baltica]